MSIFLYCSRCKSSSKECNKLCKWRMTSLSNNKCVFTKTQLPLFKQRDITAKIMDKYRLQVSFRWNILPNQVLYIRYQCGVVVGNFHDVFYVLRVILYCYHSKTASEVSIRSLTLGVIFEGECNVTICVNLVCVCVSLCCCVHKLRHN